MDKWVTAILNDVIHPIGFKESPLILFSVNLFFPHHPSSANIFWNSINNFRLVSCLLNIWFKFAFQSIIIKSQTYHFIGYKRIIFFFFLFLHHQNIIINLESNIFLSLISPSFIKSYPFRSTFHFMDLFN